MIVNTFLLTLMDMEFQPLQALFPIVIVNTTAASEHVAEIEWHIHIIKERTCAIINTLPYPRLPKWMVVELLYFVTMWLNSIPADFLENRALANSSSATGLMLASL